MSGQQQHASAIPVIAYVALGSNLEDPQKQVRQGFDALAELTDSKLLARSSLYSSKPVGYLDQPDFINAVAKLETSLSPRELLDALLAIEFKYGRKRSTPNAPRTLDLDLLLYNGLKHDEAGLTIPHPRMHTRAFVLLPLTEIDPDCEIPGQGLAKDWLLRMEGQQLIKLN
ncbi:MAG: 2-amino-4-hydroxy-6-hydroxymethyldihydropteridine diphosphokinase [Pseudomonadota bacterium]